MSGRVSTKAALVLAALLAIAGVALAVPAVWAETQRVCTESDETVVLLHGLARSSRSMTAQRDFLAEAGYNVINVDYDSTARPIEALSQEVADQLETPACKRRAHTLHFVTHSMGGILLRQMESDGALDALPSVIGRAVMISPPSQGSEVVDKLGGWAVFRWLNGPAGQQLGTAMDSVPNRLGPVRMTTGILTGDRSINLLLSQLIPGPDDGKVSVERARLEGMVEFRVLQRTHPFIMSASDTLEETLHFLEHGRFSAQVNEPAH